MVQACRHFPLNCFKTLIAIYGVVKLDGGILVCYGEKDAIQSVDVGRRLQFHEVVPENLANAGSKPCLIMLDDLLKEVYCKEVCHLF